MGIFHRKEAKPELVPQEYLPRSIGIIMDGNGRWAAKRRQPRKAGHAAGARTLRRIIRYCETRGIGYVTLYAFSTENWRRPAQEVDAIMDLLRDYLREASENFRNENVVVHFIGDISRLAPDIQQMIAEAIEFTAHKTGMVVNIAVNYGGRDDVVHAVRQIAQQVKDGRIAPQDIDEEMISAHLYTAGQPDPDMILRPSGEYRLSNFLIWQAAYSELVFMDVLWPDFTEEDMERALHAYAGRQRRFGGIK
ncbi:MAG: isoprenyl transferase [Clostridia bacterium]|nr:isoprenyl transferase [Clostridia bacterium]